MIRDDLVFERLQLKDLEQAKCIFLENYHWNGGNLRVKSVRPTIFSYRNFYVAKDKETGRVYGYARVLKNYKLPKNNILDDGVVYNKSNIYLVQVAVARLKQRLGVGRFMYTKLMEMYRGTDIYCHIWEYNTASKRLAEVMGFNEIGYYKKDMFYGIKGYTGLLYHFSNKEEVDKGV